MVGDLLSGFLQVVCMPERGAGEQSVSHGYVHKYVDTSTTAFLAVTVSPSAGVC